MESVRQGWCSSRGGGSDAHVWVKLGCRRFMVMRSRRLLLAFRRFQWQSFRLIPKRKSDADTSSHAQAHKRTRLTTQLPHSLVRTSQSLPVSRFHAARTKLLDWHAPDAPFPCPCADTVSAQ